MSPIKAAIKSSEISSEFGSTRRQFCAGGAVGLLGLLESVSSSASARSTAGGDIVIQAGVILTASGPVIKNGVVIIRNGKIVAVGSGLHIPAGIHTVKAAVVMPGLIDPHSYLGCFYETSEPVDAVTPDFRIVDAFDPNDKAIARARRCGVTTAAIMPGNSSVLGGQAAILSLGAATEIVDPAAGQKISASSDAASADRNPTSRAGAVALLSEALRAATQGRAVSSTTQTFTLAGYPTSLSERVAALRPLLQGRSRAFFHAPTGDDTEHALQFVEAYRLKGTLIHSAEASLLAARIARARVPVVLSPLAFSDTDRVLANAGRLAAAGCSVAFCTDGPLADPETLRLSAHIAVKYGLSRAAALRALTLSGAEALGIASRVGSIEPGKEADLVLLSGDPLDLTSRIEATIVAGHLVDRDRGGEDA